jgi:hypothetical protein
LHVVREMTGIKPINLESNLECPKGLDKPLWSVVCIACRIVTDHWLCALY